ncbi:MAG: hypothetical protein KatS3mg023_2774 [Armatimonadota bacterium]|nr:MAG: hypothetical protein KatS3mg023_2774 [Armatimonadota bacterium]
MVNSLHEAMKSGSGKTVIPRILNDLVQYTVSHFSTEERLMQESRYPEYPLHKRQHDELTRQVLQIKAQVESGAPVNTIEVMNFLKSWLMNHMVGSDKKMGQYILAQRKST